jgi:hypothetical protein
MVEMTTRRRIHGNGDSASSDKAKSPKGAVANGEREHHDHGLSNSQPHKHSHSHKIFGGHSHSHGHGQDGHDHGGGLIETLQSGGAHPCHGPIHTVFYDGSHTSTFFSFVLSPRSLVSHREGDRGSRVTLVGLVANVFLTSAKGAAGWYMNSAALLADAGHSLSGEHAFSQPVAPSLSGAAALLRGGWPSKPSQLTCQFLGIDT